MPIALRLSRTESGIPHVKKMNNHAHAFWITGPGRSELRGETLPALGAEDVLVRTLYSGISRGTESLVFEGAVPASEYRRMRAPFQAGDFPSPVKYGYISVGRVEAGPSAFLGRNVFCLYPHRSRHIEPVRGPPRPARLASGEQKQ